MRTSGTSCDSETVSVLLIVDDRLLGEDLAATMEEIGFRVVLSRDGETMAPTLLPLPDVVVIDAADADSQSDPLGVGDRLGRQMGLPVVYLVDDNQQASRIDQQAAGAPRVMWPFRPSDLESVLQQALAAAPRGSAA